MPGMYPDFPITHNSAKWLNLGISPAFTLRRSYDMPSMRVDRS
jgi:hypothetical protein